MNRQFDDLYFQKRGNIAWRGSVFVDILLSVLVQHPTLVYDIGCSIGEFVAAFLKRGIKAVGYEVSPAVKDHLLCPSDSVILRDMSSRVMKSLPPRADLLLFFEVAPFLNEDQQRRLGLNIAGMTRLILSTSEGRCKDYWLEKGFVEDDQLEVKIKQQLEPWKHKPAMKSIYWALKCYKLAG